MTSKNDFTISAPGRVFLFGEHSDYLGLEVISLALNKRINFDVTLRNDSQIIINYLDLHKRDNFNFNEEINYSHDRDYLRSAFNVLTRKNVIPLTGAEITVSGDIPIAAGLSSSSALAVASVMTIAKLAKKTLGKREIAEYAFEAEVLEFGESGGMMDHLASIFGGIIHVDFGDQIVITPLPSNLVGFVIGDSLEKKKDTVGDLRLIRNNVEQGYNYLKEKIADFSHRKTTIQEVLTHSADLPDVCKQMTETTIQNRDLTRKALKILSKGKPKPEVIGQLLDNHHELMRDGLMRSTEKIEKMIQVAKDAGALGCKINGSGGGGTMLAYAPGNEQAVAKALEKVDGAPYIIKISDGAKLT
ncbi:MAG: GHMP kinase [Asgard group archaeon]|nr:GHMP kinase [Asgard group archaeon]